MANVSQFERSAPVSRTDAALVGAVLTALALVGGLLLSFRVGTLVSEGLEGRAPSQYVIPLTAIVSSIVMLGGSTLWGIGMARLARIPASWRVVLAAIRGFVPITILVGFGLSAVEPILGTIDLPIHRLFTLLFVPSAGLVAGTGSLVLEWALGRGSAAPGLGLRSGLAAALAFLAVNLVMEALGWVVGGPGAAERATMLTALFAGNTAAALAAGALLGVRLTQPQRHA
jgi:hypothetical protein